MGWIDFTINNSKLDIRQARGDCLSHTRL